MVLRIYEAYNEACQPSDHVEHLVDDTAGKDLLLKQMEGNFEALQKELT